MTGKSKYSDEEQLNIVEYILNGHDLETAQGLLTPPPSIKTLGRWVDKWTPAIIISHVEKEKADRQDRHNKIKKDRIGQDKKKIRHDENAYLRIPKRFLSVMEDMAYTWLSAYKKYNNAKTGRTREDVNKIITILEIEKEADK